MNISKSENQKNVNDIYENDFDKKGTTGKRTTESHLKKIQSSEHTGSDGVKICVSRAAVVCLVLLCVLLLTAVIVLCVTFTQDRQQILTKIANLTEERNQIKLEKIELQKLFAGGWKCSQSSLYFLSSETKSWTESRRYCTDRGADLFIINNKEEQAFVMTISGGEFVWIGLNDRDVEGSWKWVDGSSGTFGFWQPGQPNSYKGADKDCALNDWQGWADWPCDLSFKWICERSIFK